MPSVAVRLATGKLPFTGTNIAKRSAHRNGNCDVRLDRATFRQAMLHECHVSARENIAQAQFVSAAAEAGGPPSAGLNLASA
jgi:hypothetical protein